MGSGGAGTPFDPPRRSRAPLVLVGLALAAVAIGVVAVAAARRDAGDTVDVGQVLDPVDESTGLPDGCDAATPPRADRRVYENPPAMTIDPAKEYTATLETTCGDITVALDAADAPVSVNNFVFLAREGFYDGLPWHRASAGFVIQGGDPDGNGTGGPGYQVTSEPPPGGRYGVGSVAWAKAADDPPGSAGSQFFVVTGPDGTSLPPDYGWLGTVTGGLDVAQTIESLAPPSGDGPPIAPVYLETVVVTES